MSCFSRKNSFSLIELMIVMFLLSLSFAGIVGGTALFKKKECFESDIKLFENYLVKAQQIAMGHGGSLILQIHSEKNGTLLNLVSTLPHTPSQKFPSLKLKTITSIFFEDQVFPQSLLIFDPEPGVFPHGTFTLISKHEKAYVTLPLKESIYDAPPLPL